MRGRAHGLGDGEDAGLRDPLSGGVYFVRNGNPLPDLFVALRGQVDFDLIGRITIPGSKRLRTTFNAVPARERSSRYRPERQAARSHIASDDQRCKLAEVAEAEDLADVGGAIASARRCWLGGFVVVACLGYSRAGTGALVFRKETPMSRPVEMCAGFAG